MNARLIAGCSSGLGKSPAKAVPEHGGRVIVTAGTPDQFNLRLNSQTPMLNVHTEMSSMAARLGDTSGTVSYTHLDVYKRQAHA